MRPSVTIQKLIPDACYLIPLNENTRSNNNGAGYHEIMRESRRG